MRLALRFTVAFMLTVWLAAVLPGAALAEDSTQQERIEQSRNRYLLGRMYEQAGDLTRAEEHYQQALEIWPDNTEARVALQALIDSRKPPEVPEPFWFRWFSWLPTSSTGGYVASVMEVFGWIVMLGVLIAVFFKLGSETIRLAVLRAKGVPLLGLGSFWTRAGDCQDYPTNWPPI